MSYLLIHGDARRIPIDLASVDAVVTDPPYGRRYLDGMKRRADYTRFSINTKWFNRDHPEMIGDEILFDPSPWLCISKVILFGFQCYCDKLPPGSVLVWRKKADSQIGTFLSDCELAWMKGGYGVYEFSHLWNGLCRETEVGEHHHPTQKPIALMRWCIQKLRLKTNSLILDPYMGSGTTGIAALAEGHRFIGIEIDRRYCDIAQRRLERPHARPIRPAREEVHPLFPDD